MWKDTWRRAARTGQAAAFALGLLASPALAYQITVGTTTYDIGFVNTSYDANSGLLTSQPWWGDQALAEDIVDALVTDSINTNTEFGVDILYFAHTLAGNVNYQRLFISANAGPGSGSTSIAVDIATGTIVGPAAVPEIDGNALAKALFLLFTLYVWILVRRNRRAA